MVLLAVVAASPAAVQW